MKQRILISLFVMSYCVAVIGQTQQTIYYDSEFKITSKNKAEYYRVFSINEKGEPIGEVKDYFITGELQSRIDGALYIDKNDDSNSIFTGHSIGYFKSGNKEFEMLFNNNGKRVNHKIWYESGNLSHEVVFRNDELDGEVKQYYENGKLKLENVFKNGKPYGVEKSYHENGNLAYEVAFKNGEPHGEMKQYHENGQLASEGSYKNGKLDGEAKHYYESGRPYRMFVYNNGELADKFFVECDEFGYCQKVFYEGFSTNDNINGWPLVSEKDLKSSIVSEKGLLMEANSEGGFHQLIRVPLDLENNFSIETVVDLKSGSSNYPHGIIWGFKDFENFQYFFISSNGFYIIGALSEGVKIEFKKDTESTAINKKHNRNLIKVIRKGDSMFYSINGTLVHSGDFFSFRGNYVGFYNVGKKSLLFESLTVKQDLTAELVADNASSSDSWKGNGTGFFIDRSGYIATNYHVVEGANEIEVEFVRNGIKQAFPAKVIQSDMQNDISIIKINSDEFKSFEKLPYNFKTNISDVGSTVFALGYPMALSVLGTEIKFTDGKISSKTGMQGDVTAYQISVPIQPGNSGGPLFDYDGNLIGITSAGVNPKLNTQNVNYAIKSSYLKNLIDVLDYKLSLPNDRLISNTTLTEKVKILSDYVVLIKIK